MSAETRDFTTQKAWCPSHPGHRWGQRVPGEAKLHPEAQGLRNPPSPTPSISPGIATSTCSCKSTE